MVDLYKQELESERKEQDDKVRKEAESKKQEDFSSSVKVSILLFFILVLGGWWFLSVTGRSPRMYRVETQTVQKQSETSPASPRPPRTSCGSKSRRAKPSGSASPVTGSSF